RMAARELVVAVGGDDERRHRVEAASKQAQDVERRLVGPMDVFDDDRARTGRELAQQLGRQCVWLRAAGRDARQIAADYIGYPEERAERGRRVQRLASGAKDARPSHRFDERIDERGLADPGLAADER